MPIYEYQCESCGNRFEKIERFSDAPLTVHEECGGHVERLISSPAFHFKGTGWYVTDYAKNGKTPAGQEGSSKEDKSGEKAEKKDAADRKSKSEGGSDSKVETKSEAKSESTKSESSVASPAPAAPSTTASPTTTNPGKS